TRVAAMRTTLESLGVKDPNQPLTEAQALEAMLAYKRSTTNFQVQGSSARLLNLGIPFFSARIAGISRLPEVIKRNPQRLLAYGAMMMTAGVMNALGHKDAEWYNEMEPGAKMNAMWFTADVG